MSANKESRVNLDDLSQWECRPRRKIVKPCLDYSQVLLREEEQALKKALYVSLRDSKHEQEGSSHSHKNQGSREKEKHQCEPQKDVDDSIESLHNSSEAEVQSHIRKRKGVTPLEFQDIPQRQVEIKRQKLKEKESQHQDADLLSFPRFESVKVCMLQGSQPYNELLAHENRVVGSLSKRTRRQPQVQRKFAHSQPCSPSSLFMKSMGTSSGWRPKTEDFIKFLCLRGTASLPKELEFFNNPGLPPSPLSSDDDEYLPVSPFFKRQVDGSSTINKTHMYSSYRRQLECEFSEASSPNDGNKNTFPQDLSNFSFETDNSQSICCSSNTANASDFTSTETTMAGDCDEGSESSGKFEQGLKTVDGECLPIQGRDKCTLVEHGRKQSEISGLQYEEKSDVIEDEKTVETCEIDQAEVGPERSPHECSASIIGTKEVTRRPGTGLLNVSYLSDSSQESDFSKSKPNVQEMFKEKPKKSGKTGMLGKSRAKRSRLDANVFERELETAPTFRPMEQEFRDPMKYVRKIAPFILKYGMCILVPPAGWQPSSSISDDIRFGTKIQHIHRMRKRDPETTKFLMYLHKCLGETSDLMEGVPQIGSCEVDLLHMSKAFERAGGVAKINTPRKWHKVADSLHIPKNAQGRINKLQDIYYKYVLPFDILSDEEKQKIKNDVESSEGGILLHEPECKGRSASVSSFHRIASNAQEMYGKGQKNTHTLESDFWSIVTSGNSHIAALSGDIDMINGESSISTTRSKSGWNISSLPQSQGSLLGYLGIVPGLTTSSLKFSSVFSTNEWQKPYDDLFRIEYLHAGADRVWYTVPSHMEASFLNTVRQLLPEIDTGQEEIRKFLVSPLELSKDECRISRAVQREGQFVLCLPNVYYCVVSSGYCLSESCYFAQSDWLETRVSEDASLIKPAKSFPAEMIILNYAKSLAEKAKTSDDAVLTSHLIETIRKVISLQERKLLQAGVHKSIEVPIGRNKRFAVDWEVCCICGRPLYPLMVWKESSFYCPYHALDALEKESTTSGDSYSMFRLWENAQLADLVTKIEQLCEDKGSS